MSSFLHSSLLARNTWCSLFLRLTLHWTIVVGSGGHSYEELVGSGFLFAHNGGGKKCCIHWPAFILATPWQLRPLWAPYRAIKFSIQALEDCASLFIPRIMHGSWPIQGPSVYNNKDISSSRKEGDLITFRIEANYIMEIIYDIKQWFSRKI